MTVRLRSRTPLFLGVRKCVAAAVPQSAPPDGPAERGVVLAGTKKIQASSAVGRLTEVCVRVGPGGRLRSPRRAVRSVVTPNLVLGVPTEAESRRALRIVDQVVVVVNVGTG